MTTTESQTNQSQTTMPTQSLRILTPPINKYTYEVYVDGLCHAINLFISKVKSDPSLYNELDEISVKVGLKIKENIYDIPTSVLCYCYDFKNLTESPLQPIQLKQLYAFEDLCMRNDRLNIVLNSPQKMFENVICRTDYYYNKERYTTIQNIINNIYYGMEEPDLNEEELKENEMF